MRLCLNSSLLKALVLAMSLISLPSTLQAGHMYDDLGIDLYRNLAENRGDFAAGATNVDVYDKSGNVVGTIPIVPDFGALLPAHGGLAGGQNWVIDCVHAGSPGSFSFSNRLGADGTPVEESYRTIQSVYAGEWNILDLAVHRLNKVATDVVHWEYATDDKYTDPKLAFENLQDVTIWRAGSGTQVTYNEDGTVAGYHDYGQATAGTVTPKSYQTETNTVSDGRGNTITVDSSRLLGTPLVDVDREENIVANNGNSGDSGSSVIFYNEETKSFQFIGVHTASSSPKDATSTPYMDYSDEFFDHVILGSTKVFNAKETSWTVLGADASGVVQLKGATVGSDSIQALAQGKRGDTSTAGSLATDAEMWASLDWVLNNGNTTLNFAGSVNTGAGTMQFLRSADSSSQKPATYFLNASDSSVNFQTAGYIIEEHVRVTSTLTGQAGDEWRIVGENARMNSANEYEIYGGFFELAGSGNNSVDLNLGVGVTVYLNRENGFAAQDVQINTGSTVILADAKQINGELQFGTSGGTLELNGVDYSRSSENLYVFDRKAHIMNSKTNSDVTFSYSKTTGDAGHELKSAFYDSASLKSDGTGVLHLSFDATAAADKTIQLSNTVQISGDISIKNADMSLTGYQLELANPDQHVTEANYSPALDPDRWVQVAMSAGAISVSSSSTLTLGQQVSVTSKTLSVDSSSSIVLEDQSRYSGAMSVSGSAQLHQGSSLSGSLTMKTGSTLVIDEGGHYDMDLTMERGSSAYLAGQTSLTGSITNEGTMNLNGQLSLSKTIQNSGTLTFAEDIALDLSQLNGGVASSKYQIFIKGTAENFTSLNSNNVIGQGTEAYLWTFNSDGSITQNAVQREFTIDRTQDFHMSSKSFISGDSLRFMFADHSSLILEEAGLSVARFYVDGVSMSLEGNGHQLEVERMLISSGGSIELIGDGLMDDTRILQLNGATDTEVILNMDAGQIEDKGWLDYYTGNVTVRNGVYVQGDKAFDFNHLNIEESGTFVIADVARIETAFHGEGTVRADGVSHVTFSGLADFVGHIDTAATSIHFEGISQAQLHLDAIDTLYLANGANSSGAITGTGTVQVAVDDQAQLSGLESFTGKLDVDGHIQLSGEAALSRIDLDSGATLELLAGAQISSATAERWLSRYDIILGAGAHLNESSTQLMLRGDNVNIGGSGTYSVKGISLSRGSAGTLNINEDAIVHIVGTSTEGYGTGHASFQLSASNHNNTLNISGTLISEAAVVNMDGRASVNVLNGGTLELRQGGTAYNHNATMGASAIYVRDGGTLLMGNQQDTIDYTASLGVFLFSGATVGADAGDHDVTIYHTLRNPDEGVTLNFLTEAERTLTIASTLGNMHANVVGDGTLKLANVGSTKAISLEAAELIFAQDSVQLDTLQINAASRISSEAKAPQLTTAQLSVAAGGAALELDSSISRLELGNSMAKIALDNTQGTMRISAQGSKDAILSNTQISHAHVEDAGIKYARELTLTEAKFSRVDIVDSFFLVEGAAEIADSSINANSSFELARGGSLTFTDMHFDSWRVAMIGTSKDFAGAMKDAVTLQNSSLTVTATARYSLTELAVHDVHGLDALTQMATIEGLLYLDVVGYDLEAMMASGESFAFDFAGVDFEQDATLLDELVLRTQGYELMLSSGTYMGDGAIAFNYIPEPSTATLSLLALAGLLARRRRQSS